MTRPGEGRAAGVGPRGPHGEIDRGVVRRFQEEELGGAGDERPFQRPASPRHALFQPLADGFADGSEPSEGDGRDRARQRPVARIDAGIAKRQIRGEALIEGTRQRHGFGDRARRRHPRGHARRGRFDRMRAGPVKSALLSSQTRLVFLNCAAVVPELYTRILGRLASGYRADRKKLHNPLPPRRPVAGFAFAKPGVHDRSLTRLVVPGGARPRRAAGAIGLHRPRHFLSL